MRHSAGSRRSRTVPAIDCPYSGPVEPDLAAAVAERLFELGCDEVALADTIGTATPRSVGRLLDATAKRVPLERIALHFHDTGGLALANVMIGLDYGVTVYDAAAGGLGGCPFAPGATGNVATEDLVYLFEACGLKTGISIEGLREVVAIAPCGRGPK